MISYNIGVWHNKCKWINWIPQHPPPFLGGGMVTFKRGAVQSVMYVGTVPTWRRH